jgi:outer membrane lipoprotein carrier protein
MQWRHFALVMAPVVALSGCGGTDAREAREAPGRTQVEAPAASPAAPAPGGDVAAPAAELPIEDASAPGTAPAGPGDALARPGAPAPAADARPAEGTVTADAILRRVERTYEGVRAMEADFVQQLTVPLLGSTQRSEGKLFQRRPDRFLMRFSDPQGDVMVADGRHFWMYTPSVDRTQVLRTRLVEGGMQADLQQQFLSNPTERFNSTVTGTESVGGRPAHVLTLVPRTRSQYRQIRVWVDQQDFLVRRFEMTEENESVRRVELRNLRLNPTLNDALFQFSPPAGTQVFDQ